jgi:hypothetical protein
MGSVRSRVLALGSSTLILLGALGACASDVDRCLSGTQEADVAVCERLCDHANADACNQLGNLQATFKRPDAALAAWKRACAMGKVEACAKLN